jgi:DNA-binding YbaB/EbfC family protein
MGGFNPKQLQDLMSQAKRQAEALQKKMQETIVDASVGGGSITLKMNGQKQVLQMTIDPEVVRSGDVEMIQDLVIAAFNEGTRKVDEAMQSSLGGMLGGMNLPGFLS